MSELFQLVDGQQGKAVAIVGMTKNVGKTVTLNHLVLEFEKKAVVTGLVSAGYDGERFDRLTLKEKPRIYAPQGSMVATAEACLRTAEASLEPIETTDFSTPLGLVCLARVKRAGLVELAGPGSASSIKYIVNRFLTLGAARVLVDGAINRLASASPFVTEAVVLATGASVGPTMADVIKKTLFRQKLFTTPCLPDKAMFSAAVEGINQGNAALLHQEGSSYRAEPVTGLIPLLAGARLIDRCDEKTVALVFGGALVDYVLEDIMESVNQLPLVVINDPTRFFISPEIYYRFTGRGGKFYVLNEINLLALTLNPTDPAGRDYNPQLFLEKIKEALPGLPVYDLVYQGMGQINN